MDGPDAAQFSVTANPTAPGSEPSDSTTFTAQFAPANARDKSATLHLASNDSNKTPFDIASVGSGLNLPTEATLAWFRACRTGFGEVSLSRRTLVEVQALGFHLERSLTGTDGERVTIGLIPAQGLGQRPQVCQVTDTKVSLAGEWMHRLIEVDVQGVERVTDGAG